MSCAIYDRKDVKIETLKAGEGVQKTTPIRYIASTWYSLESSNRII